MDFSSYTNSSRNNDNELILHKFLLSCIDHWNLNHLKIFFNEGHCCSSYRIVLDINSCYFKQHLLRDFLTGSKNTIKSFLRLSELHLQASIHFGFNNETTFNILKKDHLSTSIFVFSDNSMISEVLNMVNFSK